MAEIRPIKFSNELMAQLFPSNEFYMKSTGESGIGINVETIEIPQAANAGIVAAGEPSTLPLTIVKRTDDIKQYSVQQLYMVEPVLVTDENEIVVNYNKRADIQRSMALAINTKAGDIAAQAWGATLATNIVRTTGTDRPTEIVGATGNRKGLAYDDLVNVNAVINRMNAPAGNWYGLLTPAMVSDLFNIPTLNEADKQQVTNIQTGKVGTIFGINWMMRFNRTIGHNGIVYDNSATPAKKAVDAAGAATDNGAAIIWHEQLVCHARGHAKTYIDRDKPDYLGTVLNAKVRFGATYKRTDEVGIVTLVETAGA